MKDALNNPIAVGDVIQIDPALGDIFGGNLAIVTELKTWGCQAGIPTPGEKNPVAYVRLVFEKYIKIGKAAWVLKDGE